MKILLVSPKGPLYRHRGGIFKKNLRYGPLTLTTLAAYVPADLKAEIQIVDEGIQELDTNVRADLVAMTVITGNAVRAYELANRFRSRGIKVVLGGPHVTLIPEDAQSHADAIAVGYAEESWPQMLRDFAAGGMKPRYDQGPNLEMAGLPVPRREMLKRGSYITTHVFEATRSCVHNCEFCVAPTAWGNRVYKKPVADVVADIRQHYARRILFVDLNLISDRDYAAELFEALIPLRVDWFGLATTLLAQDGPLLDLAARSGCRGILMGFESIVPGNLRQAHKGFNTPDQYRQVVADLHRHGITLQACFTFGLDSDTPDVFMETARFAVSAGIDLPRYAIVTPFPNTPFYRRLEAEGRLLTRNWELYDAQHVVFQPAQMSVRQLYEGHEAAWKHSYSVPSMARRFAASRLQAPVWAVANLGYRFYANHLRDFYNCDWIMSLGSDS